MTRISIDSDSIVALLTKINDDEDAKFDFLVRNCDVCKNFGEFFNTRKLKKFYNFFIGKTKKLSDSDKIECLKISPRPISYFNEPSRKILETFADCPKTTWSNHMTAWFYDNYKYIRQHEDLYIKLGLDVEYVLIHDEIRNDKRLALTHDQQRKLLGLTEKKFSILNVVESIYREIDQDIQLEYWIAYVKGVNKRKYFTAESTFETFIKRLCRTFRINPHPILVKTEEFCEQNPTFNDQKWADFVISMHELGFIPYEQINSLCNLNYSTKMLLAL